MGTIIQAAIIGLVVGVVTANLGYNDDEAGLMWGIVSAAGYLVFKISRRGVTTTVAEVAAKTMNTKDEIAEKYEKLRKDR